ncbi:MAG TPA: nucleotide-binding protein [Candidatus Acidoferrum sp.]|nr:nucleotide-binding protein [Candidatus Acidoferrum sp.]
MPKRVNTSPQDIKRTVFVVYGRNIAALTAMYEFLGALNIKPLEWEQARQLTGEPTSFVGHILEAAFRNAQAVIVLLTGDDEARLRESYLKEQDEVYEREFTPQPRQNQLFEAGYAFGKFPRRTILVQFGHIRSFSDISGRYIPHFTGTPEDRRALINSLKMAECELDDSGTRWLQAGDFSKALI